MSIRLLIIPIVALLFLQSFAQSQAGQDIKLDARLVWGTDNEKPNDPKLKELDNSIKEKLKGVFKWKYYFEVNHSKLAVSQEAPKTQVMSPKCSIEVQNLGDSVIEVKLFGEGKMVLKKRQPIKVGQPVVLAGDEKNNTAWFVVLTSSN